jgi:hypothetical protein
MGLQWMRAKSNSPSPAQRQVQPGAQKANSYQSAKLVKHERDQEPILLHPGRVREGAARKNQFLLSAKTEIHDTMKTSRILSILFILSSISLLAAPDAVVRQRAAELRAAQSQPAPIRDPFRKIEGVTNAVTRGGDWYQFSGRIISVTTEGIILSGFYSNPAGPYDLEEKDFFVANFPYRVADGDFVGGNFDLYARRAGTYTYTTAIGGQHTVHKFEYGQVSGPPPPHQPTAYEKERAKILAERAQAAAAQRKVTADLATFKFHYDRAQAGNEISQRRLAELYAAGIGCEKDTNAAAAWLRAAATNSPPR